MVPRGRHRGQDGLVGRGAIEVDVHAIGVSGWGNMDFDASFPNPRGEAYGLSQMPMRGTPATRPNTQA